MAKKLIFLLLTGFAAGKSKMYTYDSDSYLRPHENINIIYCDYDVGCAAHVHEFVELIFIAGGTGRQYIDGVRYDAEAGDLFFVNYGQTHTFEADEAFRYYNLLYVPKYFSEELLYSENIYEIFAISIFKEFGPVEQIPSQSAHFRGNEFLEMQRLIGDMDREFTEKKTGYQAVLNGYSRVLFSRILRKLKEEKMERAADRYLNQIMAECLAYIDARCFEKITLKEMAEKTFYNPSYFSRIFHEYCGMSLSEYVKEKRILEAGRLLENTDLNNEEIMARIGYKDKKQFYRNFKEIFHQTPSAFRKS